MVTGTQNAHASLPNTWGGSACGISNALHSMPTTDPNKLILTKSHRPAQEWQPQFMAECPVGKDRAHSLSLPLRARAHKASPPHFLLLQLVPGRVENPGQRGRHTDWAGSRASRPHPNRFLGVGCGAEELDGEACSLWRHCELSLRFSSAAASWCGLYFLSEPHIPHQ